MPTKKYTTPNWSLVHFILFDVRPYAGYFLTAVVKRVVKTNFTVETHRAQHYVVATQPILKSL